jgi:hypothetical protein
VGGINPERILWQPGYVRWCRVWLHILDCSSSFDQ